VFSVCPWNSDMYGLDMSRPGAQDYYDSILKLYAGWGVDYIKADDIARPAHREEIAGLHSAILKTGRPHRAEPFARSGRRSRTPRFSRRTSTCGASPTISGTTGDCCARISF